MRFLHTADWHIGKKLNGYDLLADQKHILAEIIQLAVKEHVEAIVVAGDLYDRSVPPVEAVELFNQTMIEMNLAHQLPILAIAGNHDSRIRLAAGNPWIATTQFFLHTQLAESFAPIEFADTQFFLLPYFEPFDATLYFEQEFKTIAEAMEQVVATIKQKFDPTKKHVLVSHFFVAGSSRTDSETTIEVGGLDSVPLDLLMDFDYVALGHLHSKNALQAEKARYSGSPLKFSLSEINQPKGVFIVDTQMEKCDFHELTPLHPMLSYTRSFQELLQPDFYQTIDREAFLQFCLTDRTVIPNLMNQLRGIYPRILSVERENGLAKAGLQKFTQRKKTPVQLATDFFTEMTELPLTETQAQWLASGLKGAEELEKGR